MNACMHKKFMEPTSFKSFRKSCIASFKSTDVSDHNFLLLNHLLLIFKYNTSNSRVNNCLSLQSLKCVISRTKYIEETINNNDLNKK